MPDETESASKLVLWAVLDSLGLFWIILGIFEPTTPVIFQEDLKFKKAIISIIFKSWLVIVFMQESGNS